MGKRKNLIPKERVKEKFLWHYTPKQLPFKQQWFSVLFTESWKDQHGNWTQCQQIQKKEANTEPCSHANQLTSWFLSYLRDGEMCRILNVPGLFVEWCQQPICNPVFQKGKRLAILLRIQFLRGRAGLGFAVHRRRKHLRKGKQECLVKWQGRNITNKSVQEGAQHMVINQTNTPKQNRPFIHNILRTLRHLRTMTGLAKLSMTFFDPSRIPDHFCCFDYYEALANQGPSFIFCFSRLLRCVNKDLLAMTLFRDFPSSPVTRNQRQRLPLKYSFTCLWEKTVRHSAELQVWRTEEH